MRLSLLDMLLVSGSDLFLALSSASSLGITDGTGGQEQSGLEMKLGHQQSDVELCACVCVGVCAHRLVLKLLRLGAHRSPLRVEGPSPS